MGILYAYLTSFNYTSAPCESDPMPHTYLTWANRAAWELMKYQVHYPFGILSRINIVQSCIAVPHNLYVSLLASGKFLLEFMEISSL